ncbi:phosphatidate cytidylyltransferase [Pseudobdellovibrio exovorus]|uniref:Phosphatidate cytidylyltransferase n=1 Tax=Pseudobdellovibrio exovorus JSS TaxID=1184267 RepID=M4V8L3_9BACT|nr:phosphatidate cytidylyltransferase [Pseudobdellovibrio exovorus]AGH94351.1 phosphatidate cytidylyltransferase [Pseudobdellovibrio exovorus JSS]
MTNLSFRVLSAVIALAIFIPTVYFGREHGIYVLALFVVARGAFEMARMLFADRYPKFVKRLFVAMVTSVFLIITQDQLKSAANFAFTFSFVLIASFGIFLHKQFKDLEQILTFATRNSLGMIYICYLPATVVWTTQTEYGVTWFICLLSVVFAGDIGAYLFGMTMGRNKIAPDLSPKKSVEGSIGGLLFSIFVGVAFHWLIPTTPVYVMALCGLFGGFFGQVGDFFESLIKRVSGVKDSGSIMPGHGGVLDRLDGVLFAAPVFYFAATYF